MAIRIEASGKYPIYYEYVRQYRSIEEMLGIMRQAAGIIPETEREAVIRDATAEIQSQNVHSLKQLFATRFVQVIDQSVINQRKRAMGLFFREFVISRRIGECIDELISLRYPGVNRVTYEQYEDILKEVDDKVRREREQEQFEDAHGVNRPFIYGLGGMVCVAEKVDKL